MSDSLPYALPAAVLDYLRRRPVERWGGAARCVGGGGRWPSVSGGVEDLRLADSVSLGIWDDGLIESEFGV